MNPEAVLTWLNENQGAAIAVLTAILLLFNAWLLLETRAVRVEKVVASVESYPMPWEMASMYLAGRIENGGPGLARDLVWTVTQMKDGRPIEDPCRYAQPMLRPGQHRTMMLHQRGRSQMLRNLADEGVTFAVEWSWTDGRRWLGVGPHRTHGSTATWDTKQLAEDFYQAFVLVETPPMVKVGAAADEVKKSVREFERIRRELERMRRMAERVAHRDQDEEETGPDDA